MSATLLLAELYKGDDPIMVRLRTQLGEIARTLGLVTVLIEGPPGTGKTTMARALAMARVLSVVDPQCHRLSVDRAVREVREGAALKWYRDISLAGLTDTLADAQLFGIGEKVASDVTAPYSDEDLQGIGPSIASEVNSHLLSAYTRPACLPATSSNRDVFAQ